MGHYIIIIFQGDGPRYRTGGPIGKNTVTQIFGNNHGFNVRKKKNVARFRTSRAKDVP